MRLSTMRRVDAATTADGRNPIAEEIVRRWTDEPVALRFFRSSANVVYTFAAERGCVLRFADAGERSAETIAAELDLVRALARYGLPVAVPVPSRGGNLVETVTVGADAYHVCVFPLLGGHVRDLDELDPAQLRSWGAALGRLHAATRRLRVAR